MGISKLGPGPAACSQLRQSTPLPAGEKVSAWCDACLKWRGPWRPPPSSLMRSTACALYGARQGSTRPPGASRQSCWCKLMGSTARKTGSASRCGISAALQCQHGSLAAAWGLALQYSQQPGPSSLAAAREKGMPLKGDRGVSSLAGYIRQAQYGRSRVSTLATGKASCGLCQAGSCARGQTSWLVSFVHNAPLWQDCVSRQASRHAGVGEVPLTCGARQV